MFAELIALYSAMGWAGDAVLVRLGTRRANIFAAMLVSYSVSVGCMAGYVLLTRPLDFVRSPAMGYFLMSGCLQPLFARALYYEGLTRIGVSRAGPLRGAEPLFAAAIGVILLDERPSFLVYLGTLLIVASIWLVNLRRGGSSNWRLRDGWLPLGAALVSAVSQTLRKQGLKILPDPFIAMVTVTSTSLLLFLIFVYTTRRTQLLRIKRDSLLFFVAAACFAVSAQLTNFVALGNGDLSVIIPLLNTTPLFTVVFSSLFLRSIETVTPNVVLGAVVMIAGVLCITLR